MALGVRNLLCF